MNGFTIRGFWHCPECGFNNMSHGRGPPYICDECSYQLYIDEGDEDTVVGEKE